MDIAFIEKLIKMVGNAPIEELELERDGWRIRIVKFGRATIEAPRLTSVASAASGTPPAEPSPPAPSTIRHVVRAMLTGTFYRSATENGPPLVSVGDAVDEGQSLGILEAMKVLNPIESPVAGRVTEILAENAAAVNSGAPLFTIEIG